MNRQTYEIGRYPAANADRLWVNRRFNHIKARYRKLDELYDIYDFLMLDSLLKGHSASKEKKSL